MAGLRRPRTAYEPWPGYVDALSTLLMVIIFVLLVFVLSQAFLSVALSGRDQALARLNRQVAELSDLLALERGTAEELRLSVARLSTDLQAMTTARDTLNRQVATLTAERERVGTERDAARSERERLSAQLAEALLRAEAASARAQRLEGQLAEALTRADQTQTVADARARDAQDSAREAQERQRAATEAARALAETRRQLEDERAQLARMREAMATLDRQVTTDRATIELRLSEIARLNGQIQALTALRDELERRAAEAAARATTEEEQRRATASLLEEERRLGESARAQVALLNRQIEELRSQIGRISAALDAAEAEGRDKDAQIASLGSRLNLALAARVEELQRYRSEFFGRLREVLGNRAGIQVVGDRFVFQSEVLFPVGSADLQPEGVEQIRQLAGVIREISRDIPSEVNWILRVDGHADRSPIGGAGRFTTNWELSAARAITVVRLLALLGVPENRLAATGFGEFQPLDTGEGTTAFARNRRIELRLTDR
ncbi:peptidoglycan -binding protein [Elioraea sp.]|uniref:peptidoglycan -binding protein n=1 Tax=Elioraea sp. TaxID=2185103 RepID=UPI0025C247B9|nr:peptidoglycan -binding protein [Elioraea sp.]